jgi:hypothetical protein
MKVDLPPREIVYSKENQEFGKNGSKIRRRSRG